MESIVITARSKDDSFDRYLGASLNNINTKCINVADKPDTDKVKSIATKYNIGVSIAKNNDLLHKDTIVVFAKPCTHIIDNLAMDKISMIFDEKPNVGVIGVMGAKTLHSGKSLYEASNSPVNGIVYTMNEDDDKGEHVQYSKNGFYDNVVAVDDSVFAVRGSLLLDNDMTLESESDSGYGIEMSIKSNLNGYSVVVADILVLTEDRTTPSSDIIGGIVSNMNLHYPITSVSLGKNINSVVDIDI